MATTRQNLVALAARLDKKKIGPIRLVQTIRLPRGPLHLVSVGDIETGLLPSFKDLRGAHKEWMAKSKSERLKSETWSSTLFVPPFIKIKELVLAKGTFYLVMVGDLGKSILPTIKDLENVRDLFSSTFKAGGLKNEAALFFPPILDVVVTRAPGLHCVLGNKGFNILPQTKDIKQCRQLVFKAVKDLGIKFKDVKVESVMLKNFKD